MVSSEQTVEVQAASPFLGALAGEERARPLAAAQDATVRKVSLAAPLPAHELGIVGGVYQEDGIVGRYTWVVEPELGVGGASSAAPKQAGVAAVPRPKIAPEVADAAQLGLPIPVIINLKQDFGTSLRDVSFERFTSFDAGQVNTSAERKARIVAREAEAAELQKPVSSALADLGIPSSGFWLVNALAATVPPALVPEIAKLAAVRSIACKPAGGSGGNTQVGCARDDAQGTLYWLGSTSDVSYLAGTGEWSACGAVLPSKLCK